MPAVPSADFGPDDQPAMSQGDVYSTDESRPTSPISALLESNSRAGTPYPTSDSTLVSEMDLSAGTMAGVDPPTITPALPTPVSTPHHAQSLMILESAMSRSNAPPSSGHDASPTNVEATNDDEATLLPTSQGSMETALPTSELWMEETALPTSELWMETALPTSSRVVAAADDDEDHDDDRTMFFKSQFG
jgi:hypothetical protein